MTDMSQGRYLTTHLAPTLVAFFPTWITDAPESIRTRDPIALLRFPPQMIELVFKNHHPYVPVFPSAHHDYSAELGSLGKGNHSSTSFTMIGFTTEVLVDHETNAQ